MNVESSTLLVDVQNLQNSGQNLQYSGGLQNMLSGLWGGTQTGTGWISTDNVWTVSTGTTYTVPAQIVTPPEDEVAWLRRRVREVCWRP